jgi:hypothetical protein
MDTSCTKNMPRKDMMQHLEIIGLDRPDVAEYCIGLNNRIHQPPPLYVLHLENITKEFIQVHNESGHKTFNSCSCADRFVALAKDCTPGFTCPFELALLISLVDLSISSPRRSRLH